MIGANTRLGIISGTPAFSDGERVWINHSNGRTFDGLLARYPRARIVLPLLSTRRADMKHALAFPMSAIDVLPPLASTIAAQRHYLETRRIIRRFAETADVLFIRFPFQVAPVLQGLGKPKVVHVVSNPQEVVKVSSDYRGVVAAAARAYAAYVEHVLRVLVREPRTSVVSNGDEMWRRLKPRRGRVTVSSCLREAEMTPRTASALNEPPRLLFVGYLRPEKGIDVLLEAFEKIRAKRPVRLSLVGGSDRAAGGVEGLIEQRIARSPYAADIQRHGMVDFGDALFDLYRGHDVYVLPSRSEGTPRTLIEARAFGLPVVATSVGGIPTSVTSERDGLLVPPGDAGALARAIERLLDDQSLRARLIDAGLTRARARSLEAFVGEIGDEIDAVLSTASPEKSVA